MRNLKDIADELISLYEVSSVDDVELANKSCKLRNISIELVNIANKLDMPETIKIYEKR